MSATLTIARTTRRANGLYVWATDNYGYAYCGRVKYNSHGTLYMTRQSVKALNANQCSGFHKDSTPSVTI